MSKLRKITARLPARDLADAQAVTRQGVSATVRLALRDMVHWHALREFRELRGTIRERFDLDALREDRELG